MGKTWIKHFTPYNIYSAIQYLVYFFSYNSKQWLSGKVPRWYVVFDTLENTIKTNTFVFCHVSMFQIIWKPTKEISHSCQLILGAFAKPTQTQTSRCLLLQKVRKPSVPLLSGHTFSWISVFIYFQSDCSLIITRIPFWLRSGNNIEVKKLWWAVS